MAKVRWLIEVDAWSGGPVHSLDEALEVMFHRMGAHYGEKGYSPERSPVFDAAMREQFDRMFSAEREEFERWFGSSEGIEVTVKRGVWFELQTGYDIQCAIAAKWTVGPESLSHAYAMLCMTQTRI